MRKKIALLACCAWALALPSAGTAQTTAQTVIIEPGPPWAKAPTDAQLAELGPPGSSPSTGRMECRVNPDGSLGSCMYLESAGNIDVILALRRAKPLYAVSPADAAKLNARRAVLRVRVVFRGGNCIPPACNVIPPAPANPGPK